MSKLNHSTTNCNSLRKNWRILADLKAKNSSEETNCFAQLNILCRQYSLLKQPQSFPPLKNPPYHIGEILTPLKSYYLQDQEQENLKQEDSIIDLDRWHKVFARVRSARKANKEHPSDEAHMEELRAIWDAICLLYEVESNIAKNKAKTNC